MIYSLACPVRFDAQGRRLAGCGKGWTSPNPTEPCSTCGLPASIRGSYSVTEMTEDPLQTEGGPLRKGWCV